MYSGPSFSLSLEFGFFLSDKHFASFNWMVKKIEHVFIKESHWFFQFQPRIFAAGSYRQECMQVPSLKQLSTFYIVLFSLRMDVGKRGRYARGSRECGRLARILS
jgi:hypothetical protein